MKTKILLIFLFGLLSLALFSQGFDTKKLDSYFDALEKHDKFMGSVAVLKNGELIYTRSVGYSDLERKQKADVNTRYRIGSISKTFTAVLVMKAVEENKLDLGQTIETYFPEIENAEKISISNLLYHRSGIYNFTNDPDYLTWNTKPKTEKEIVKIISEKESVFEPDSKADYSNSNYVLLTYILEKVFQKPYAELLRIYITEPLDLHDTYLGKRIDSQNGESNSYRFTGKWEIETETDISIPMGAGGIVTTSSDLVKFSDALFGGKLLKKESLEKMMTIKDNFGIGMIKMPFYDKTAFGHTGGIDGFSSVFMCFRDDSISYALTSNGSNYYINNISLTVLNAIFRKPYKIPEFKKVKLSSKGLDLYAGTYSSAQLPLKMIITREGNSLKAQATGQSPFPLEPVKKNVFEFVQAGIVMEFNSKEKSMILKQSGMEFLFNKE